MFGPASRYREHFGAEDDFDFRPRYNVAPSQTLPVIWQAPDRHTGFTEARWGLLPSWVKDPREINRPINAKAETAAVKPMFRHAFRSSRVLVPADAFYEWKIIAGGKQPYLIRMRDQSPFGMAGLLEHWRGPEGEVQSFAILTTSPNTLMAGIHDRMPAIVAPEHYAMWLDAKVTDVAALLALLGPYPEQLMEAYPVSRKVNSPANDDADLIVRSADIAS